MLDITIKINIPERFDNSNDDGNIDTICYRAALDIVSQFEKMGFLQKPDDSDYNDDDPGCIVEYYDINGEYDRPGQ